MEGKFENSASVEKPKQIFVYRDYSDPEKPVVFEVVSDSILKADALYKKETGFDPAKQAHIGCSVEGLLEKQQKDFQKFLTDVVEKEGLTWKEFAEQEEKDTFENYLQILNLNEQEMKDKKILDIGADKCLFASYCVKHGISKEVYSVEGGDESYIDKQIKEAVWSGDVRREVEKRTVHALMQSLSFADESFELVVCNSALPGRDKEHFGVLSMEQDLERSYDEISRVLKSGGEARIGIFELDEEDEYFGNWAKATKKKLAELAGRSELDVEMVKVESDDDGGYCVIIRKKENNKLPA